MMSDGKFGFPAWFDALPDEEKPRARAKFIVRCAALIATQEGTVDSLSLAMGYGRNTVQSALGAGRYDDNFPVNFVMRLEDVIGRDTIPREILNKKIFDRQIAEQ